MFGVEWLTIPILLGLFTAALGVVRLLFTMFFSASAKWQRMHDWLVAKQAQYKAEWDRLRASYHRIDAEPKKTGQVLIDALNDKFNRVKKLMRKRNTK